MLLLATTRRSRSLCGQAEDAGIWAAGLQGVPSAAMYRDQASHEYPLVRMDLDMITIRVETATPWAPPRTAPLRAQWVTSTKPGGRCPNCYSPEPAVPTQQSHLQ